MKMSRLLFVLMAFVLVLALVACGGDKEPATTDEPAVTTEAPAGDEPAVTTEAPAGDEPVVTTEAPAVTTTAAPVVTTTAAPSKFTVKFVDAEEFDSKVLSELSVSRGKAARAPINPSHDGDIFLGWDVDDYSSITEDMVITATYRPVDTYYVTLFNGPVAILTLPEYINLDLSVVNNRIKLFSGTRVEIDNPEFEEIYDVFSDNDGFAVHKRFI